MVWSESKKIIMCCFVKAVFVVPYMLSNIQGSVSKLIRDEKGVEFGAVEIFLAALEKNTLAMLKSH